MISTKVDRQANKIQQHDSFPFHDDKRLAARLDALWRNYELPRETLRLSLSLSLPFSPRPPSALKSHLAFLNTLSTPTPLTNHHGLIIGRRKRRITAK
jgi:hypothetical protein